MTNRTPFPNLRFVISDNQGRDFGVAVLKGTFEIAEGRLVLADEQAPILFEDVYHGELNVSSLYLPSDVVSRKPRTDIIVNAIARTHFERPAAEWTCGIAIEHGEHPFSYRLRVHGPRHWRPTWRLPEPLLAKLDAHRREALFKGWTLSAPQPVSEVPIR